MAKKYYKLSEYLTDGMKESGESGDYVLSCIRLLQLL